MHAHALGEREMQCLAVGIGAGAADIGGQGLGQRGRIYRDPAVEAHGQRAAGRSRGRLRFRRKREEQPRIALVGGGGDAIGLRGARREA